MPSGPLPTWRTNGTPRSARRAQNGSWSTWPGDRPPGARAGSQISRSPRSRAASSSAQRPVDVVEVAQADAEQAGIGGAERGDGAVVGAVGAVAQVGLGDVEQRRAQRGVHDLVLEAEQVEGRRSLGRVDGAERGVPLRALAHEVVAELDQRLALAGGRDRRRSA